MLELAIALTVLAVLLLMALPSYSTWIQNSQIRTAAESVESGLQLARAEAIRRNAQVSFTLTGNDWSVDVVNPAINIEKRSDLQGTPNAIITSSLNPITFNGGGRIVPPAVATLNVTNATAACQGNGGPLRCLNVQVLAGGGSRLCDPMLATPDAESCQ